MMEEETVLEGWDLHLTIQKLQAPAISGMQLQQRVKAGGFCIASCWYIYLSQYFFQLIS